MPTTARLASSTSVGQRDNLEEFNHAAIHACGWTSSVPNTWQVYSKAAIAPKGIRQPDDLAAVAHDLKAAANCAATGH